MTISRKKIWFLIWLLAAFILIAAGGFLFWRSGRSQGAPAASRGPELLRSSFGNAESYGDIFSGLAPPAAETAIEAGVVPHHFLAKELIARFYSRIADAAVETVVLISPDHFANFFKPDVLAYTSALSWETPFGVLAADAEAVDSLVRSGALEISDSAVGLEHGLSVEAPFIKKFFPRAKLVPVMLKGSSEDADLAELGRRIKALGDPAKIRVIVSSDFSHDLPAALAAEKDKKSLDLLRTLSPDKLDGATNDCRSCLAVLAGYLDERSFFSLIDNKNSFDLSGENEQSVTSYISGFYSRRDYAQLLFLGDLMLDRSIRQAAQKNGNDFIFARLKPWFMEQDLVIANLEGPITANKSVSVGSAIGSRRNFIFTFDPSVAKTLFDNYLRLVSLGNNHILNFGAAGLVATRQFLDGALINYFGAPPADGESPEERSFIKEIRGLKIAFVNYNQFVGKVSAEQAAAREEIAKIKKAVDVVIVYAHWGAEYTASPNDAVKKLARDFIDAGADLIIGSHPHVIQSVEEYKGKKIYYSLGNFIFDQYFDPATRRGLGVTVKINLADGALLFEEKELETQLNGQTILKTAEEAPV